MMQREQLDGPHEVGFDMVSDFDEKRTQKLNFMGKSQARDSDKVNACSSPLPGRIKVTMVQSFDADDVLVGDASPSSSSDAMSSPAAHKSPTTSPMSSSGVSSVMGSSGSATDTYSIRNESMSDSHSTHFSENRLEEVKLEDYESGEEKSYWFDGNQSPRSSASRGEEKFQSYEAKVDADDDFSDGAPSLEGSPDRIKVHDVLKDMGFRETIARAATEHCDDISVAVQYATDYNIHSSHTVSHSPQASSSSESEIAMLTNSENLRSRSPDGMLRSATEYSSNLGSAVPSKHGQFISQRSSSSSSPPQSAHCSHTTLSLSTPSGSSKHSESESKEETRQDVLQRHLLQLGFRHTDVESAVRRCNSTPAAARFIMDGGVAGWERKTKSTLFECGICMSDDVVEEDMITLDCNHRFCRYCMMPYIASLIENHKVIDSEDFVCPEVGCSTPLDLPIVKSLVSEPAFERLLDLKLRKEYAESREEVRTCPKCSVMVVIEDMKQNSELLDSVTCINKDCKHKFCGRCGLDPHKNQKDLDVSCEDYAAFVEANDKSAQIFEEYLRENKMKRCPKCLLPAELKSGCNFIRCVCKTCYCYLCGRELFEHSHYSHYHKGPYSKRCYGGSKDKKGYIALPACEQCKGPNCKKCADSCEAEKRKRLEKISQKLSSKGKRRERTGVLSWIRRRFKQGNDEQRRRQRK